MVSAVSVAATGIDDWLLAIATGTLADIVVWPSAPSCEVLIFIPVVSLSSSPAELRSCIGIGLPVAISVSLPYCPAPIEP